jgi:hypothetical protein
MASAIFKKDSGSCAELREINVRDNMLLAAWHLHLGCSASFNNIPALFLPN